jgi:8-oxo-dGTP pyrophosphatase MutT (NUDIX family)
MVIGARSGDGFVRCGDGHVRWGLYGAAGAVFVTTGIAGANGAVHVLLQLRSGFSHEGGTWSCPGGALDLGEAPLHGALREAAEEVGVPSSPAVLVGQYVFRPSVEWSYTTVVVRVDEPFGAPMNFETEAVEWVLPDEVERRPLHPGFAGAWPHVREIVERI